MVRLSGGERDTERKTSQGREGRQERVFFGGEVFDPSCARKNPVPHHLAVLLLLQAAMKREVGILGHCICALAPGKRWIYRES